MAQAGDEKQYLPHLLYAIAAPFFEGARVQLGRYKQAALHLKQSPVYLVQVCIFEVSSLFEHLATVAKYAEMAGHTHPQHSLWVDIRNHIRHDVRENMDIEDKRKSDRATRLGINKNLQISLNFDKNYIEVGNTKVTVEDLEAYLVWAGKVIGKELSDAQQAGRVTGVSSNDLEYWQNGMI